MIGIALRLIVLSLLAAMAGALFYAATVTIDASPIGNFELAETATAIDAAKLAEMASLGAMSHTRERPLFQPSRRPIAPAVNVPEAAPAQGLTLIGLMRVRGNSRKALVRLNGENRAVWVGVGGIAGGSTIREIGNSSIIVERDRNRVELSIRQMRRGS